jgi:replicative DNA helicase
MNSHDPIERVLIAHILQDSNALKLATQFVSPADLRTSSYAKLLQIVIATGVRDVSVIASKLPGDTLTQIGGVAELYALSTMRLNGSSVVEIAETVKANADRRRVAVSMRNAADDVERGEISIGQGIQRVLDSSSKAVNQGAVVYTAEDSDELMEQYFARLKESNASGFGLVKLDRMIGGLSAGRFVILSGFPGSGKTTLMVQAAVNMARAGKKVVFVSAEMRGSDLFAIVVSHLGQVDMSPEAHIKAAEHNERLAKIRAGKEAFESFKSRFVIVEAQSPDIALLNLQCQRHSPDLLICDYLQLMASPNKANREQDVSTNAQGLKSLAVGRAVLTGSQVNREGKIRESDGPWHHCDCWIHIDNSKETPGNPDVPIVLEVRKNRGGGLGNVDGLFRKRLATFASSY